MDRARPQPGCGKRSDLGREDGATISLFHATEADTLPREDLVVAEVRGLCEAEKYLLAVARRLRRRGYLHVETTHVSYSPAASGIIEAAVNKRARVLGVYTTLSTFIRRSSTHYGRVDARREDGRHRRVRGLHRSCA